MLQLNDQYDFYLVDLNQMKFHDNMSSKVRIDNFRKLTAKKEIVAEMSKAYAEITGQCFETVFTEMWQATADFQDKFMRKQRLKKTLKFWKRAKYL